MFDKTRQRFDPERRSREARRVETAEGLFQVILSGAPIFSMGYVVSPLGEKVVVTTA